MIVRIVKRTEDDQTFYFAHIFSENGLVIGNLLGFSKDSLYHQLKTIYGIDLFTEELFTEQLNQILFNHDINYERSIFRTGLRFVTNFFTGFRNFFGWARNIKIN